MKRSTPEHPKVSALMRTLRVRRYAAVGLLEMLWHFTARFAHQGNIGRFADQAIADALDYPDGAALIEALVVTGWVDRCDTHRLVIHDWGAHADQGVKNALKSRGLWFVEGRTLVRPGSDPSLMYEPETSDQGPQGIRHSRSKLRRSRAPRQNLPDQQQEEAREVASLSPLEEVAIATSNIRAENAALRDGFVAFWAAYPARRGRKDAKQPALREWMRLAPSLALQRGILEAVGTYAASTDLPCDAVRWLKACRWEDEKVFVAGLVDLAEPVKAPVYEKPADGGAMGRLIRAGMPPPTKGVWRDD